MKILQVNSGSLTILDTENQSSTHIADEYKQTPRWVRKIEEYLRLDLVLALKAKLNENYTDIIWVDSEKVGIPISFMHLQKPLVVVAHHMSSPVKAKLAKATGIVGRWDGIGFISDESKNFFIQYFGVDPSRLFQYESAKYLNTLIINQLPQSGKIISAGVAKRDYATLIKALANLPNCETELFLSSKFGDKLITQIKGSIPQWVSINGWVPEGQLLRLYQSSRFCVIPLHKTTHSGAGINAALEAGAFSKAVVATDTGGMRTFVKDGETGILVPPYDIQAWQRSIEMLWENPELAQSMGNAGRQYMEYRFNPDIVQSKIISFLKSLHEVGPKPSN
jgi:glycosyltransferase involved in cell wall biosynthesis